MQKPLEGKKVAVLIDEGVEQFEFTSQVLILKEAGAEVGIIAQNKKVTASDEGKENGVAFSTDANLEKAIPENFDALLLPGGVIEAENLRMNNLAIEFVKHFIENNKPIGAISYGQYILIAAGGVKGKKITSHPVLKVDFINAGAKWQDEEVVLDENLLTCQSINYLSTFNDQLIPLFSKSHELVLKALNTDENKDKKLNMHPTDSIGENPSKKWGVSEVS